MSHGEWPFISSRETQQPWQVPVVLSDEEYGSSESGGGGGGGSSSSDDEGSPFSRGPGVRGGGGLGGLGGLGSRLGGGP